MPATAIAILTADLHLCDYTWADRRELFGDSYFAFQEVCELACRLGVNSVVVAGDAYDRQRNESTPSYIARKCIQHLTNHKIELCFVQGNHDRQRYPWFATAHDAARHLHGQLHDIADIPIYGLDWQSAEELPRQLELVPDSAAVLVMHQVTQELLPIARFPELSIPMLPHASWALVGDYHQHLLVDGIGAHGQPVQLISPGSTSVCAINEEKHKSVYILYDDLSLESAPLRGRVYLSPPLMLTEEDMADFIQHASEQIDAAYDEAAKLDLPDHLRRPVLRVQYSDAITEPYRRIRRALRDCKPIHLFKQSYPHKAVSAPVEATVRHKAVSAGLIGCWPLVCDPVNESVLFSMGGRLLEAENPESVLAEIYEEHMGAEDAA